MPVSKANQRAVNKYVKNNYDRVNVTMPKGKKDTIQAHAELQGQSVNAYINAAIDARMGQESTEGAGVVSLPSEAIETAQKAAQSAGETVPQFVERAVATQAKRDKTSLAMGINPSTGDKLEKEV